MPLPKEKQQKIILIGILTVMAVAVFWQLYISKKFQSISKDGKEIRQMRAEVAERTEKLKQFRIAQRKTSAIIESVRTQADLLVSGDPFAWLGREMGLMAEQNRVRLLGIAPMGPLSLGIRAGGAPEMHGIRLLIACSYDRAGEFIANLENKYPTLEVRAIEITTDATSPDGQDRALRLEVYVAVKPPNLDALLRDNGK
jgi:hypothetical protein